MHWKISQYRDGLKPQPWRVVPTSDTKILLFMKTPLERLITLTDQPTNHAFPRGTTWLAGHRLHHKIRVGDENQLYKFLHLSLSTPSCESSTAETLSFPFHGGFPGESSPPETTQGYSERFQFGYFVLFPIVDWFIGLGFLRPVESDSPILFWQIFARTRSMDSRPVWSMKTISLSGASRLSDRLIRSSMWLFGFNSGSIYGLYWLGFVV